MNSSILEAILGKRRANDFVSFVADDMMRYVDARLGTQDEFDIFEEAIDKCISENTIVQLIQMSDDDAISEFGIRLAVELERMARNADDDGQGYKATMKRFAAHYASWLMSVGPEEYESDDEEVE